LDPAKPLKEESEMTQRWVELQSSPPTWAEYESELVNQWQRIGCAVHGAPYVVTALTQILGIQTLSDSRLMTRATSSRPQSLRVALFPFAKDISARLAIEFLKEDCVGARGISEYGKAELKAVAASAHP
jgi:hypothetical protein